LLAFGLVITAAIRLAVTVRAISRLTAGALEDNNIAATKPARTSRTEIMAVVVGPVHPAIICLIRESTTVGRWELECD
jgi:hypothetical protein